MTVKVLIPQEGSWNKAPLKLPEPGQFVLVLINTLPQIGFLNPDEFTGWATLHCKKGEAVFTVFAEGYEQVYWSALPTLDELKLRKS